MALNFVPNKDVLISADRRGLLKLWEVNTCKLIGEKTPHCLLIPLTQPAITCSKLTVETLKQGVKYVQS